MAGGDVRAKRFDMALLDRGFPFQLYLDLLDCDQPVTYRYFLGQPDIVVGIGIFDIQMSETVFILKVVRDSHLDREFPPDCFDNIGHAFVGRSFLRQTLYSPNPYSAPSVRCAVWHAVQSFGFPKERDAQIDACVDRVGGSEFR